MGGIVKNWGPQSKMGEFMSQYVGQFERIYPPYINYLDNATKEVKNLENTNPRFNAFCKARLAKGTYCRQSLSALLALPFQRVPRYILLLESLLKSIKKFNAAHEGRVSTKRRQKRTFCSSYSLYCC